MNKSNSTDLFTTIYQQNCNRIHYHLHALNIRDPHREYFQMGTIALWQAYRQYEPDKGPMGTYFNYMIRHRLIDHVRQQSSQSSLFPPMGALPADGPAHYDGATCNIDELIDTCFMTNHSRIRSIRAMLTSRQWTWFSECVLHHKTIAQVANDHHISIDTVKGWQRQARKKFNTSPLKSEILEELCL